jgi:hypothetical protein
MMACNLYFINNYVCYDCHLIINTIKYSLVDEPFIVGKPFKIGTMGFTNNLSLYSSIFFKLSLFTTTSKYYHFNLGGEGGLIVLVNKERKRNMLKMRKYMYFIHIKVGVTIAFN